MKRPIDLIVFDLDGTLVDNTIDIAFAVNQTMHKFGKPPLPLPAIAEHVGHGVKHLVKETLQLDGEAFLVAHRYMLDVYYQHCVDNVRLYPQVKETLAKLHQLKKRLAVCTNKPLRHSEKTLKALEIDHYFTGLVAGDSLKEKKPHPMGLEHLVKQAAATVERTLMVGDSQVDIATGKAVGVMTCGCRYGLRPLEELESAKPDFMVNQLDELLEYVV